METLSYIVVIFGGIVFSCGLINNALTLAVLFHVGITELPVGVYLISMTISDLTVLFTGLLPDWIIHAFNVPVRTYDLTLCKIIHWVEDCFSLFSSWIIVLLAIDRFRLIYFPLTTRVDQKASTKLMKMFAVVIGILFFQCHELYGMGGSHFLQENSTIYSDSCGYISKEYKILSNFYDTCIYIVLYSILPLLLLLAANISIIVKFRMHELSVGPEQPCKSLCANNRLLGCLSMVLFVTSSPLTIVVLLQAFSDHIYTLTTTAATLTNQFSYTNYSFRIFIYMLTVSQFRKGFISVCSKKYRVSATETLTW